MQITYKDIKHRLQPPLDCAEIKDLRGQYFHNRLIVNYKNTDFAGCVLYQCYPSGILLNALEINPAKSITDVTVRGADLRNYINFGEDNLAHTDFSGTDLREVDFRFANFREANLEGANLKEAVFLRADLRGANLRGADLRGARLQQADLRNANLKLIKTNVNTNFAGSLVTDKRFAEIYGAYFIGENSKLEFANLSDGLDLSGANLRGSNLYGADIQYTNLHGADLQEADLRNLIGEGSDLSEANLEGANLSYANLELANLRGANLRGADFCGAILIDVITEGADFSGARYSQDTDFGEGDVREQAHLMTFVEDED